VITRLAMFGKLAGVAQEVQQDLRMCSSGSILAIRSRVTIDRSASRTSR
jgi:hypothetical protein